MSVMIRSEDRTRLKVMGDIEAACGDGDACRFAVSQEGAAIVRIQRDGDRDILRLDWSMEWVMIASADNTAQAGRGDPLPELPGLFA